MVKVGDKIEIVKPWMTDGQYKKGDVLTVRKTVKIGVFVEEVKGYISNSEYTVIAPPAIKAGDKVRLIDKPWEHYIWNRLPREKCGWITKHRGDTGFVDYQTGHGDGQYCMWNDMLIPTALLERVEEPPALHRYTPEQEQEARDIVYRLLTHLSLTNTVILHITGWGYDSKDMVNKGKQHTLAILLNDVVDSWVEEDRAVAFCSPDDEWSDDVGRLVALCKLLDEPLPKWVRNDRK